DQTPVATLYMTLSGDRPSITQPIGLDGVYRLVPGEYGLPQGARGYWADERTFLCEYDEIAASNHLNLKLTFIGNQIILESLETDHEYGVTVQGWAQE
ncbi:MAG: hypothetical protein PHG75_05495, partial [Syntrophomonas sp.]|nr:hypothetical protein [Syntrophomonas sp.]